MKKGLSGIPKKGAVRNVESVPNGNLKMHYQKVLFDLRCYPFNSANFAVI
jgi:hypothetical protein